MPLRHFHIGLILGATLLVCFATNVGAQDNSAIIANLKQHDSIYAAGFTAFGTLKEATFVPTGSATDVFSHRRGDDANRNWRLTYDGSRCAYLMETANNVRFQKPATGSGGFDKNGSQVFSARTKEWDYWGQELCGNFVEDTIVKISPAEKMDHIGSMYNTCLYKPNAVGPTLHKQGILWSLGRFYSNCIDKITSVRAEANGRIFVEASGWRYAGLPGRWELEIEPAAQFMVRKARFYSNLRPNEVNCEIINNGTVWRGSYCIPQSASFTAFGPVKHGDISTIEVTFRPVIKIFDKELYAGAHQLVTQARPPKLTIQDRRVLPELVYQPDQ